MNRGILYALGCYLLWGVLPIFWKGLQSVPAVEILAHRVVWSLLLMLLLMWVRRDWSWLRPLFSQRQTSLTFVGSSMMLTINWGVYIWAVNHGQVVAASLGYFINPLVSVALGRLFLGERLRPWQTAAILVAIGGVLFLTISFGALPWISLALACSFGFYGLLRKTAVLGASTGLTLETMILFLPALAYLLWQEQLGVGQFGHAYPTTVLMMLAGVVTAVPLLLFAAAARRVTLTTIGLMQYIAPTLQFLIGVFLYQEPFTQTDLIGFVIIWTAVLLYASEAILNNRKRQAAVALLNQGSHS